MTPEDTCSADMLVLIRWQGWHMAVPLSRLAGVNVDELTAEASGDWHYSCRKGTASDLRTPAESSRCSHAKEPAGDH
jgi:hypothetical protein